MTPRAGFLNMAHPFATPVRPRMRWSRYPIATVKEVPSEAEVISHQLMLRAGLIRRLAAGIYTWTTFGLRSLRKVEQIIREEMDRAGAHEVLMPAVQPAELWQESGRWDKYGPELLRLNDRHQRAFVIGPTHEEVITDFARRELKSYRQLPVNFYQIQTKFRDEIRPRFGVMRGREFIMKDAYSFHADAASLRTATPRCATPIRACSPAWVSSSARCRPTPARSAAMPPRSSRCSPIRARMRSRSPTAPTSTPPPSSSHQPFPRRPRARPPGSRWRASQRPARRPSRRSLRS